jgi:hypothetical protein
MLPLLKMLTSFSLNLGIRDQIYTISYYFPLL